MCKVCAAATRPACVASNVYAPLDSATVGSRVPSRFFHNGCIQQWLDKHSQCPLCRAEVGVKSHPLKEADGSDGLALAERLLARWASRR